MKPLPFFVMEQNLMERDWETERLTRMQGWVLYFNLEVFMRIKENYNEHSRSIGKPFILFPRIIHHRWVSHFNLNVSQSVACGRWLPWCTVAWIEVRGGGSMCNSKLISNLFPWFFLPSQRVAESKVFCFNHSRRQMKMLFAEEKWPKFFTSSLTHFVVCCKEIGKQKRKMFYIHKLYAVELLLAE